MWLAVVAETAVLVVALVGALAAYLPPHAFWWAQLVALGLPYWTALLALATLSLLLRKQRGWALGYAVLLAWVLVRTVPLGWAGAAPEASPDDLVLLTFNTPASGASREVLADGVYAFFEQTVPTVASLQEAITITSETQRWQPNHLDLVTDSLRYRVPMPPFEANGMAQTSVPLYVRPDQAAPDGFVVLEQRGHTLMPDEDYPSEVLRTHFRWRGREGVHYNLHLASFGMDKPWNDGVPFYSLSGGLGYLRQYRDAVRRRGRRGRRRDGRGRYVRGERIHRLDLGQRCLRRFDLCAVVGGDALEAEVVGRRILHVVGGLAGRGDGWTRCVSLKIECARGASRERHEVPPKRIG